MDIEIVSVEYFTSTFSTDIEINDLSGNKLRFVKAERYLSKNNLVSIIEIYIITDKYGNEGEYYLIDSAWNWNDCRSIVDDYIRFNLRSLLIKKLKDIREQQINDNIGKLLIFSLLDYNDDIITIIVKIIIDLIPEKHYLMNF